LDFFYVDVRLASWHALNKHKLIKIESKQIKFEENFKSIWCHWKIFVKKDNAIKWCFLLPLYFLELINLSRDVLRLGPISAYSWGQFQS
jgi:hypothetical protein